MANPHPQNPLPEKFHTIKPESQGEPRQCPKCGATHTRNYSPLCASCWAAYYKGWKQKDKAKKAALKLKEKAQVTADKIEAEENKPGTFKFVIRCPGGKAYLPNPRQIEFHECQTKFRALIGGRRSGKSIACLVEAIMVALYYPGVDILIGQYHLSDLVGGTWKHLRAMIPSELIQSERRVPPVIQLKNGSTFYGKGLADANVLGSKSFGFIMVEEISHFAGSEDIYAELVARLSTPTGPNRMILCGYPQRSWYWRRFIEEPDDLHWGAVVSSHDNAANLPTGFLSSLKRIYSQEEYLQYVEGEPGEADATIFYDWDDSVHTCPPFKIPDHWKRYLGVDPGWGDNCAIVWLAVSEEGKHYAYALHRARQQTISEQCQIIRQKTGDDKIEWAAIDPYAAKSTSDQTGKTREEMYREHGLGYIVIPQKSNDFKEQNIALVQEMLRYERDEDGPGYILPPQIQVFNTQEMQPLIHELKYWQRDSKGKPRDRKDDALSSLLYVLATCPVAAERQLRSEDIPDAGKQISLQLRARMEALMKEIEEPETEYSVLTGSNGIDWY